MLEMLAKFFKIINGDANPGQIALGFAFALCIGLTPFLSLHNLLILFLVLAIRVNLSAFFLGCGLFSVVAYGVDPLSIKFGQALLASPSLQDFWGGLYQSDFWRVTKFNHTLLLGSLSISLLLFVPLFLISRSLISLYRERVMAWFARLKVCKLIRASKLYKLYAALGA
ncbi:MAG: TIGR03546 family protein [Bermanella sp.]